LKVETRKLQAKRADNSINQSTKQTIFMWPK